VASEATGLPVHAGSAETVDPGLGPYDLVALVHVFEHLADPVAALGALARLLAPGGRLVLLYPNPAALAARWFGPDWFHWDPPRHLSLPPIGALPAAVHRAGLEIVSVRTLARWGGQAAANSRACRDGRAPEQRSLSLRDRLTGTTEALLVAAGFNVGEEVVASLARSSDEVSRRGAH
jgi:SAM-dependent methyltransferase